MRILFTLAALALLGCQALSGPQAAQVAVLTAEEAICVVDHDQDQALTIVQECDIAPELVNEVQALAGSSAAARKAAAERCPQ